MCVPLAFTQERRFQAAIARVAKRLPYVADVNATLGSDWAGDPAVFFMVILADTASGRDQLLKTSHQASQAIVQQVQPLGKWGVLPYFNFRSQSEQAHLDQAALA